MSFSLNENWMSGPVDRMLDILELLGTGKPMDADQISAALGVPASSTYRFMKTLRRRHVVFQPPGETTFQIGFAVLRWADTARQCLDLVGLARASLQLIAEATHETASLTLLNGNCAVTADVIEGQGPVRVAPDRGRMLPLHAGAASKAILAFLPSEYLPRGRLDRIGPNASKTLPALKADLQATRERGFATSVEEVYEGAAAAAVPIFLADSRPVGSLAVSGPLSRMQGKRLEQFAALLKAEAARLNALLNSGPPAARMGINRGQPKKVRTNRKERVT